MWSIGTFGLMCAACIAVAACARTNRSTIMLASVIVSANWLLFCMPWIYAPASVAFVAYDFGIEMRQEDAWSLVDLTSLCGIVVVCRHLWWAPILWSAYLITLAMHAVAWANGLEYIEYRRVLDAALIIQLATLFVVGGGDCADRLSDCWRRLCRVGGNAKRVSGGSARANAKVVSS